MESRLCILFLSTFSFHKEVMYRDIIENEEQIALIPLIQALTIDASTGEDLISI